MIPVEPMVSASAHGGYRTKRIRDSLNHEQVNIDASRSTGTRTVADMILIQLVLDQPKSLESYTKPPESADSREPIHLLNSLVIPYPAKDATWRLDIGKRSSVSVLALSLRDSLMSRFIHTA